MRKNFEEDDVFYQMGGMKSFGETLKQPMALVMSIWNDQGSNMEWLDSNNGTSGKGGFRGPCKVGRGFNETIKTAKTAQVTFSNIQRDAIQSYSK